MGELGGDVWITLWISVFFGMWFCFFGVDKLVCEGGVDAEKGTFLRGLCVY